MILRLTHTKASPEGVDYPPGQLAVTSRDMEKTLQDKHRCMAASGWRSRPCSLAAVLFVTHVSLGLVDWGQVSGAI